MEISSRLKPNKDFGHPTIHDFIIKHCQERLDSLSDFYEKVEEGLQRHPGELVALFVNHSTRSLRHIGRFDQVFAVVGILSADPEIKPKTHIGLEQTDGGGLRPRTWITLDLSLKDHMYLQFPENRAYNPNKAKQADISRLGYLYVDGMLVKTPPGTDHNVILLIGEEGVRRWCKHKGMDKPLNTALRAMKVRGVRDLPRFKNK